MNEEHPTNIVNNSKEPIVLGELKKEKSSKPFFAFLVFALVLSICFALPYIVDYINNENTTITETIKNLINTYITKEDDEAKTIDNNSSNHSTEETNTNIDSNSTEENNEPSNSNETDIIDNQSSLNNLVLLNSSTILNIDNIFLDNISISNNNIYYRISARSEINLDENNYVLEIYNENKEYLGNIKLSGYARTSSQEITIESTFSLSATNYYVRLVNQNGE